MFIAHILEILQVYIIFSYIYPVLSLIFLEMSPFLEVCQLFNHREAVLHPVGPRGGSSNLGRSSVERLKYLMDLYS